MAHRIDPTHTTRQVQVLAPISQTCVATLDANGAILNRSDVKAIDLALRAAYLAGAQDAITWAKGRVA